MDRRLACAAIAAALAAACYVPAPAPHGPPPAIMAEQDPVGFLLERADSLLLPDSTRQQMALLNLRLFSRNRPLQTTIDTLVTRPGERASPDAELRMAPETRVLVDSLTAQIRVNNAAARDTAWAMLSDRQRQRADSMLTRARSRMEERNGSPPPMGGPPQ